MLHVIVCAIIHVSVGTPQLFVWCIAWLFTVYAMYRLHFSSCLRFGISQFVLCIFRHFTVCLLYFFGTSQFVWCIFRHFAVCVLQSSAFSSLCDVFFGISQFDSSRWVVLRLSLRACRSIQSQECVYRQGRERGEWTIAVVLNAVFGRLVSSWLLNVPATCISISGLHLLICTCCPSEIDHTYYFTRSYITDTRPTSLALTI